MLIVIPLGALVTSLVFDALHLWRPQAGWFRAAFVASLVGAVTLVSAIAPGLWDYFKSIPRRGEIRSHASIHFALGISLTGYFIASALARWAVLPAPTAAGAWAAFVFNLLGHAGLVVQYFLGAGLTYTHQVGVRTGYLQELPPPSVEGALSRGRAPREGGRRGRRFGGGTEPR